MGNDDRFIRVHSDSSGFGSINAIYVDKVTGVQYFWRGLSYGGGLTVMLNSDGKPLLYQPLEKNDTDPSAPQNVCAGCRNPISSNARFCSMCGAKVNS